MVKDFSKRLSKSKINTFCDCPKKYYLGVVHPQEFIQSDAMIRGSEIHDMFEKVYEFDVDTKEKLKVALDKLDPENKHTKVKEHFIKWSVSRGMLKPEYIEDKVYNADLDFVAIVDRIDFDGQKRTLLDYKTGQKHPVEDYKRELLQYCAMYSIEYGLKFDYAGIYFADHGECPTIEITEEDIIKTIAQIDEFREQIQDYQNQDVWPIKKSWKCRFCNVKHICDYGIEKYGVNEDKNDNRDRDTKTLFDF